MSLTGEIRTIGDTITFFQNAHSNNRQDQLINYKLIIMYLNKLTVVDAVFPDVTFDSTSIAASPKN